MTEKDIKKISTFDWWQAETPVSFQLIYYPCVGFSKVTKHYPGVNFWKVFLILENNYAYQFVSEKDSINLVKYLIENDIADSNFIKNKIKEWEIAVEKINKFSKKIDKGLSELNNVQLFSLAEDFFNLIIEAWGASLILEGAGTYFEKEIIPKIKKEYPDMTTEEIFNDITTLVASEKLSFTRVEQLDLFKIALLFIGNEINVDINNEELKDKFPVVYKKIVQHQKKYYWIKNSYLDSHIISVDDFLKEIKNILLKQNKEAILSEIKKTTKSTLLLIEKGNILKKLKLPMPMQRELQLISIFGWWQDERKKMNLKSGHYITIIIKEIAGRMNIDYQSAYNLYFDEIKEFLLKGKKIDLKILKSRKELHVFSVSGKGVFKVIKGGLARKCKDELFDTIKKSNFKNKSKTTVNELKGMTACMGKESTIVGKVKIILNPKDNFLKEGEILVTSMTRPEFLPYMKKAKAIITNEGGITSHAAIISRELGIPCVIGTKFATEVLKNGDLVEVDIRKGIIKILKRK